MFFQSRRNTFAQVTFSQFLSVIADMVGGDVARSSAFVRAVQRLCLSEYMEVMKTVRCAKQVFVISRLCYSAYIAHQFLPRTGVANDACHGQPSHPK